MATNVRLLDCTLRDGGYVNDWDFGHSVLTGTFKRLDAAGVDYIEIGFLDDRRPFDENRSIMPSTEAADRIFSGVKKKHAMAVAMIDYGTCSLDHIAPHTEDSFIDGIRVIFKKERIDEALPFCKAVKEKGYKLSIQAISITAYSDSEMLAYVEQQFPAGIQQHLPFPVNEYGPAAYCRLNGVWHGQKRRKLCKRIAGTASEPVLPQELQP